MKPAQQDCTQMRGTAEWGTESHENDTESKLTDTQMRGTAEWGTGAHVRSKSCARHRCMDNNHSHAYVRPGEKSRGIICQKVAACVNPKARRRTTVQSFCADFAASKRQTRSAAIIPIIVIPCESCLLYNVFKLECFAGTAFPG